MILQNNAHPQPLISVIIPTLNGSELIETCISSLLKTVRGVSYELIVVDDGSRQEEKEKIRHLAAGFGCNLIDLPTRHSYAKAVNAGLKVASGKFILLLNNDVIFRQTGWLSSMLQTVESAWNIGIVGCRLLYPNGTIQHAGGRLLSGERYDHLYRGQSGTLPKACLTYDVESVTGALLLIKKEVIDDIGLLCEDYPLSYEDVDFCLRARQSGWRVIYCGKAVAIHNEGTTRGRSREEKPDAWYEEELRSHIVFWTRWVNFSSIRPLQNFSLAFVLSNRSYVPSDQKILNLAAGLREQGCQIFLEKVTDSKPDFNKGALFEKLKGAGGQGVIFCNDGQIIMELKKDRSSPFPAIRIYPFHWNSNPYPQDVYIWLNMASKYMTKLP